MGPKGKSSLKLGRLFCFLFCAATVCSCLGLLERYQLLNCVFKMFKLSFINHRLLSLYSFCVNVKTDYIVPAYFMLLVNFIFHYMH